VHLSIRALRVRRLLFSCLVSQVELGDEVAYLGREALFEAVPLGPGSADAPG
jgi:hypothetical protein